MRASLSLTPCTTANVLVPDCLVTSSVTERRELSHAEERSYSPESSACPMSDTLIEVPLRLAINTSLNASTVGIRPKIRKLYSWCFCSTRPPGISTFWSARPEETSLIGKLSAKSFSGFTITWISRSRPPTMLTAPTPRMFSIFSFTFFLATSVKSTMSRSPDTTTFSTAMESISSFCTTGASVPSGNSFLISSTLSRTSWAATSPSLSISNLMLTRENPSILWDLISSIPSTWLTDSSTTLVMEVSTSSGLAPAKVVCTSTYGTSTLGNIPTPMPE